MPGPDGYLTSAGMFGLRSMIAVAFPVAKINTYQWSSFAAAAADIKDNESSLIIVIGYSGGGSRATWLANLPSRPKVDLMVLYDPSPSWQMKPIGKNVKHAVTYHNQTPFFFGLGGGVLTGSTKIDTVDVSKNHMLVQSDMNLHRRTIQEIAKTVSAAG